MSQGSVANLTETFVADTDLTAKQYYAVTSGSAYGTVKVATGASNPGPIGILQNAPSLNGAAEVVIFGRCKAAVSACDYIGSAASDVDAGHRLQAGPDGLLYYASCGLGNAVSHGFIGTGSAVVPVFFNISSCAYSAS